MYSKSQMKKKLHEKPCYVVFTKVNGEERTMVCTLNEELIPKAAMPKNVMTPNPDTDIVRVYDLEKEAWRSFHMRSVTEFSTRIPKDRK